jgi:hypothetical protein
MVAPSLLTLTWFFIGLLAGYRVRLSAELPSPPGELPGDDPAAVLKVVKEEAAETAREARVDAAKAVQAANAEAKDSHR